MFTIDHDVMKAKKHIFIISLFTVSCLLLVSSVHGQTTSIEEEAAGAVLEMIDNFREGKTLEGLQKIWPRKVTLIEMRSFSVRRSCG